MYGPLGGSIRLHEKDQSADQKPIHYRRIHVGLHRCKKGVVGSISPGRYNVCVARVAGPGLYPLYKQKKGAAEQNIASFRQGRLRDRRYNLVRERL